MKTKYLAKNTAPHIGKLLKEHILKHRIYRSSLARHMERRPTTIEYYLRQPTFQLSLLWEISKALKHNFFMDLAAQLPPEFSTNAPDPTTAINEELEQQREENKILQAKLDTLKEVLQKG